LDNAFPSHAHHIPITYLSHALHMIVALSRPEITAKGKLIAKNKSNNCVIYTRVSSKEQEEGHSLETQKKLCEEFALKNNHAIMGYFGGTYESAKTDERKEFNRMLQFVKRSGEKISFIIISHIDRFSRTGANAIYIKEQLKIHHVWLQAATTPVDPKTSIGDFQQNVQFIFSHYDNQVRKERTIMGTRQALLNGHWCAKQPFGYDAIKVSGQPRKIVVNETGRLLKKAFVWKATEQITHDEICIRLKKLGLYMNSKRLAEHLRNPFYCGLLTHNCLEGQVVEGKHEKLISKDIFLKVNDILKANKNGYNCQTDADTTPLRRFMKCDCCNASMRGYIVMKKKLYYYKCNTPGCKNNRNAQEIDGVFERTLRNLSFT
jgi:site-specific DNA recombinase